MMIDDCGQLDGSENNVCHAPTEPICPEVTDYTCPPDIYTVWKRLPEAITNDASNQVSGSRLALFNLMLCVDAIVIAAIVRNQVKDIIVQLAIIVGSVAGAYAIRNWNGDYRFRQRVDEKREREHGD